MIPLKPLSWLLLIVLFQVAKLSSSKFPFNLFSVTNQEGLFSLRQEISLSNISTIPSLVVNNGDQISLVTKNQTLIFECTELQNCAKIPKIISPKASSDLTDLSISEDYLALATVESSGALNIFWLQNNGTYLLQETLSDSNESLSVVRMIYNGNLLITGGDDMIGRVYVFNRTSPSKYTKTNNTLDRNSPIVDIGVCSIMGFKNFIFVASGQFVGVYEAPFFSVVDSNFIHKQDIDFGADITTIDSLSDADSISSLILVVGGKNQKVALYQYNTSSEKLYQSQILVFEALIYSVSLSPEGKYLSIGKNDNENEIYESVSMNGEKLHFYHLQQIKIIDQSNYVRSLKFASKGQMFAQARDDHTIRTYSLGDCPSGTHFENGFCIDNSYTWIIVGSIAGVCFLGIVLLVFCKKLRKIPGEVLNSKFFDDDLLESDKSSAADSKKRSKYRKDVINRSESNDAIRALISGDLEGQDIRRPLKD